MPGLGNNKYVEAVLSNHLHGCRVEVSIDLVRSATDDQHNTCRWTLGIEHFLTHRQELLRDLAVATLEPPLHISGTKRRFNSLGQPLLFVVQTLADGDNRLSGKGSRTRHMGYIDNFESARPIPHHVGRTLERALCRLCAVVADHHYQTVVGFSGAHGAPLSLDHPQT